MYTHMCIFLSYSYVHVYMCGHIPMFVYMGICVYMFEFDKLLMQV